MENTLENDNVINRFNLVWEEVDDLALPSKKRKLAKQEKAAKLAEELKKVTPPSELPKTEENVQLTKGVSLQLWNVSWKEDLKKFKNKSVTAEYIAKKYAGAVIKLVHSENYIYHCRLVGYSKRVYSPYEPCLTWEFLDYDGLVYSTFSNINKWNIHSVNVNYTYGNIGTWDSPNEYITNELLEPPPLHSNKEYFELINKLADQAAKVGEPGIASTGTAISNLLEQEIQNEFQLANKELNQDVYKGELVTSVKPITSFSEIIQNPDLKTTIIEESLKNSFKGAATVSNFLYTPNDLEWIDTSKLPITKDLIATRFSEWKSRLSTKKADLFKFLNDLNNKAPIAIVGGLVRDVALSKHFKDIDVISNLYTTQLEDYLMNNKIEIVDRTAMGAFIVFIDGVSIDIWSWPDQAIALNEVPSKFTMDNYPSTMFYSMDAIMAKWSGAIIDAGFIDNYNSKTLTIKNKNAGNYKRLLAKKAVRLITKYNLKYDAKVQEFIDYHTSHGLSLSNESISDGGSDNYI